MKLVLLNRFNSLKEVYKTLSWLLGKKTGKKYVLIIISAFLLAILELVFLTLTYLLINKIVAGESIKLQIGSYELNDISLNVITFLLLITLILRTASSIIIKFFTTKILASRESEISVYLIQKSLFEKRDSYNANNSADFLQIFTGIIPTIFMNVLNPFIGFISEFFSIVFILIGASSFLSQGGTWVFIYLLFIGLMTAIPVGKFMKNKNREVIEISRDTLKKFLEFNKMREEILLSHREDLFLTELQSQQRRLVGTRAKLSVIVTIPRYFLELALIAGFVALTLINQVDGDTSGGLKSLGVLVAVGFRLLPPINSLIVNYSVIKGGLPNVIKMKLLSKRFGDSKVLIPEFPTRNYEKTSYRGDLIVKNLEYKYPTSDKLVIRNLSFTVPQMTTVWIKGPSGAGKTTLVSLISGFLSPTSGELYARTEDEKMLIDEKIFGISYLGQSVPLIDASFAYNIALKRTGVSELDQICSAAQKAGILEKIQGSPDSFDSIIGENGSQLSAGERQRLGLARSIYLNPNLLILDEPTANLDKESEALIWNSIQELKKSMTIIIVSHREVPATLYDSILNLGDV